MPKDACFICGLENQKSENAGKFEQVRVDCERCGTFVWEPSQALASLAQPKTNDERVNLSAFVREQNAVGITPLLTAEVMGLVKRRRRPRLRERASRVLTAIAEAVGSNLSETLIVSENSLIQAVSYSADENELSVLLELLEQARLITVAGRVPTSVVITTAGLIQAEELSQPGTGRVQGFVAMSFDPAMN